MVARLVSISSASDVDLCSEISDFARMCGCGLCFCYHFYCRFFVWWLWFLMGLHWVVENGGGCGCANGFGLDFGFLFFIFLWW